MKKIKKLICVLIVVLLIPLLPILEVITYFNIPSTYSETYYGEFGDMYNKLKTTEKKKIVVIGNSAVAFGINISFIENEIDDYVICPFGLYGSIGTKAMLDISLNYLNEGDIVLITPEINTQAMSLYFSADEIYKAADGNIDILKDLNKDDYSKLVGGFQNSLQERYKYYKEGSPVADGVYSHKSFNSNCQMIYQREYNIMPALYDENDPLDFNLDLISDDFVNYLNNYYKEAYLKKASVYYDFTPINKKAIMPNADIEAFTSKLRSKLMFPIIGDITNYILDERWFYDSNFHLNSSGSILYSSMLTDDIKSVIQDYSVTYVEELAIPEPPVTLVDGDNSQAGFFTYEKLASGYKIVAMDSNYINTTDVIIPTKYDDMPVVSFDSSVFSGNGFIETITIPASVRTIYDHSFNGCYNLKKIIMLSTTCNSTCGFHLLDGANNAFVYVADKESYFKYTNNYYWGNYTSRITYNKEK